MDSSLDQNSKAATIKRILDIQADQLNEKFKRLFFYNLDYETANKDECLEKKKNTSVKKSAKMIHDKLKIDCLSIILRIKKVSIKSAVSAL